CSHDEGSLRRWRYGLPEEPRLRDLQQRGPLPSPSIFVYRPVDRSDVLGGTSALESGPSHHGRYENALARRTAEPEFEIYFSSWHLDDRHGSRRNGHHRTGKDRGKTPPGGRAKRMVARSQEPDGKWRRI